MNQLINFFPRTIFSSQIISQYQLKIYSYILQFFYIQKNHKNQNKTLQPSNRRFPERQFTEKEEQRVSTEEMGNQCCAASETVIPDANNNQQQQQSTLPPAKPAKQTVEEILNELLKHQKEEDRQFEYQGVQYIVVKRVEHSEQKDYVEYILKKLSDGENYSLKILKNSQKQNEIVEEINTIQEKQQNLKGDNIVRFYGYSFAGNQLCVLQEGNGQGTLNQFINAPFSNASAHMIFGFIIDLYEALKEFYKESIYPQVLTLDNIVIINNRIKIDTLGVLEFGQKITYNENQDQIQRITYENRIKEKKSIKESGKIVMRLLLRMAQEPFEEYLYSQCPQIMQNFYLNITSDQLERRSTVVEAALQVKLMSQNSQIVSFVNQNYFLNQNASFALSKSQLSHSQIPSQTAF